MPSSCCILSEDQLLCCICLRMFTDPVSTPCGHNCCKTCITQYWDNSDYCKCPMCNKIFGIRPDLSVNTFISETAAQFRKSTQLNSQRAHAYEDKTCCEKLEVCLHLLLKLEQKSQKAQKNRKHREQKAEGANCFLGKWSIVLLLFSLISIYLTSGTMWMYFYAVDVTLDPDTAHPYLILSDDGKQVRCGDTKQNLPDNPKRFNPCANILGKEGFSSGRFYYEVQVSGKTHWDLGVARGSINRKGQIILTPQDGFWTVWLRNGNEYSVLADPPVSLSVREKLQKVGVFVDYEEGLVSFYNVEDQSHIYSFTGQSFNEKLYPFVSPGLHDGGENSAPLIISGGLKTTPIRYLRIFFAALLKDLTGVLSL